MNCKEFDSLILPYLSEKLDEAETELFEIHYFSCEKCYSDLKIAQYLNSGRVPIKENSKQRFFVFKPVFALSSLVLFLVLSTSLLYIMNNSKKADLYKKISEFSPPLFIKTEIRGNYNEKTFNKAMKYYLKNEYEPALEELTKISSKKNINYKVLFFKAVCNLLLDKLENAQEDFSIIIKNMNPSYFDEAIYYKGITLLRMGEKEKAISVLENISTDKYSPLFNKATDLIKRIEQL